METKKIKKAFTLGDFCEEEAFLQQQHAEGWKFMGNKGNVYHFTPCDPEEVAYVMDKVTGAGRADKLEEIREAGWKHVSSDGGWEYFSKPVEDGVDRTLFHTAEERLALCKKAAWLQMLAMVPVYLLIPVVYLAGWLKPALSTGSAWIGYILIAIFVVLVIAGLAMNLTVLMKLNGMKETMAAEAKGAEEDEDPEEE